MGRGKDKRTDYFERSFINLSEAQYVILDFIVNSDRDSFTLKEIGGVVVKVLGREVSYQYVSQEVKGLERLGLISTCRHEQLWVYLDRGLKNKLRAVLTLLDDINNEI